MIKQITYTISELAEKAAVTPRTIRYYVAEGLLPAPAGTSRAATYNQEHFDRLKLIKVLKDEYLPLQEINSLLGGLKYQEVKELLAEKQKSGKKPSDSAKDYLKSLLQPVSASSELMHHKVKQVKQQNKHKKKQMLDNKKLFEHSVHPISKEEALPSNSWQRISLNSEVELHIKTDSKITNLNQKIKNLIKVAHQIFNT